ncbi:MAG: AAA-ATPase [Candidatus Magnetoglobus multicellularis str. Araruama]|uniref:AAA-ATPase n=1 Tax=Candidatus Magnetoglobus multicellularis str. Araruama TaxID=890399 RepID=A0A1V1PCN8_9BACT|nr:MAG: AAA-ATPase [Candidatus Magnetoglobus multicellularis str. Araruama]
MNVKKIPYGDSDYGKIIKSNMYYVDKTKYIHELEALPNYIFLIRPRRFGKSLWINLLQYYYDCNREDQFDALFKDTFIGKNPTPNKNRFMTLAFNFSMVEPKFDNIQDAFQRYVNKVINDFLERYSQYFANEKISEIRSYVKIDEKLQELFFYCTRHQLKVYMFIDEYDNFTNTILTTSGKNKYIELTHGEGSFRYFFNLLKGLTSMPDSGLDKLFITGVSPVTMDDVTSGFNIGTNVSLDTSINEFMGFTESETMDILQYYHQAGRLSLEPNFCMDIMKQWYNNYRFAPDAQTVLFNSDMVLYFVQQAMKGTTLPIKLIDQNVKIDYKKLRYLMTIDNQLNGNFSRLKDLIENQEIVSDIVDSFPVEQLIDQENFISLLYYFGLLTIHNSEDGVYLLKIPNITIQKLMYGYIRSGFEDVNVFKIDMWLLQKNIRDMAFRGNWKPFFQFLSEQIDKQTAIRDYLNGEKVIQGFLLAYLNVVDYYITQSESEMNKGYSDIYMEPFMSKYPDLRYSYLIELKYIARGEYSEEVQQEKIQDAQEQLDQYVKSDRIQKSIASTKLIKIILVYKGWELIYCEEYV